MLRVEVQGVLTKYCGSRVFGGFIPGGTDSCFGPYPDSRTIFFPSARARSWKTQSTWIRDEQKGRGQKCPSYTKESRFAQRETAALGSSGQAPSSDVERG
jgi:hypothetical protein